MMRAIAIAIVLAGCGGPMPPTPDTAGHGIPEATVTREGVKLPAPNRTVPGEVACFDRAFAGSPDSASSPLITTPCWRPILQISTDFLKDAEVARARARAEREAFPALVPAEQGACAGLTETEIALSPFYYRDDIVRVDKELDGGGLRGVEVRFGAVPGLTPARLEAVVRCHLARAQVLCDPSVADYCPLVLRGVTADIVESPDGGVVVRLTAPDEAGAMELLRRVSGM